MILFVAKLHSETTSEDLQKLFAHYGEISSARVIFDKETGNSKRYGFVEMPNENEAKEALKELNETKFQESIIIVKKSQSHEDKAGSRSQSNFERGHEYRSGNDINKGNYYRKDSIRKSYSGDPKRNEKSVRRSYDFRA